MAHLCRVYLLDIRQITPSRYKLLCCCAKKSVRERAERYKFREDRVRCLAGDYLVTELFVRQTGIPREKIEKGFSDYGKPYIRNDPGFHFNLSHSGDYVACAVSDHPVGIDIQQIVAMKRSYGERIFSPRELAEACLEENQDLSEQMIEKWAYKESFAKLKGMGILLPFDEITIAPGGVIRSDGECETCFFQRKRVNRRYCLVTASGDPVQISYFEAAVAETLSGSGREPVLQTDFKPVSF